MEFRTKINIPHSELRISHQSKLMMLGSCFAQNIGEKLMENKFDVNVNPFGILYNPASIAKVLRRIDECCLFDDTGVFCHNGLFHSHLHHSSFSNSDKGEMLETLNESLKKASDDLTATNVLLVTFGTGYVFRDKQSSGIVANCHKLPASAFDRYRLSVQDIVDEWSSLIENLRMKNPSLNILFTVSPIRHWKDGAHDNQLSKAVLLLAIDALQSKHEDVFYFPSYELVLDDLRDYRFYAEDMLHPSEQAIKYIWSLFGDAFFDQGTHSIIKEWNSLKMALNHRPFNPHTEEHKQFLRQTMLRLETFQHKYPYIRLENEKRTLVEQLK